MNRVEPQPNQVVNEQPVVNQGELSGREVVQLQEACISKQNATTNRMQRIIRVVSLVAAIWAGIALSNFFLGVAVFLVGDYCLRSLYNALRTRDYTDAASALETPSFKQYIQTNRLDLSIDSIVKVHKEYKKYVAAQAQVLAQRPISV